MHSVKIWQFFCHWHFVRNQIHQNQFHVKSQQAQQQKILDLSHCVSMLLSIKVIGKVFFLFWQKSYHLWRKASVLIAYYFSWKYEHCILFSNWMKALKAKNALLISNDTILAKILKMFNTLLWKCISNCGWLVVTFGNIYGISKEFLSS